MLDAIRRTPFRSVSWRILTDFLVIHACLLVALAAAVTSYTAMGHTDTARTIADYFPRYYGRFFWPLSLVFPVVFLMTGVYERSGFYTLRYRVTTILRGAGLSLLIFLAANYLMFRNDLVSRSVAIWFSVLLTAAMFAAPFLERRPKEAEARSNRKSRNGHNESGPILVVGGAGYIGSIVVRQLLDAGHKVRVLDRLVYGYNSIEDLLNNPNFQLIVGDCRNIQTVVRAVKGTSTIIDLAAIVGDPACEEDRQTALETNYAATRMLIEVAKGFRIKRFLFASSCSVYGATDELADETSPVRPISLYAQTKVDSEQALLRAHNEFFHPTILRFATVFGFSYRPRFDLVVNLLSAKAHQEGAITIFNGTQWRPFIHVRDIAAAVVHVMNAPLGLVSGQIFNVGSPDLNYTLTDVATKIRQHFPDTRVENVENSDRRNYRVSFKKIQSQLGFDCSWNLDDGIRELRQAFEDGKVADYRDISYDNRKFLKAIGISTRTDEMDAKVMAAFSAPCEPFGSDTANLVAEPATAAAS
ncbi:MAG TPA: NAD-dependent epimerase/dehydratase family protein [Bryobacteraceae bacterium]|nr:NAD-dependent epimerase/dehydratase family protein [Bryobacteraceae bacterium]